MENNQTNKNKAEQKKHRRKIIAWVLMAAVVFLLAVMPVLAAKNESGQEQTASILSGTVEYGSIDTQIIGGGQLASEAAIKLQIPEEVKLTEYLVGNGDTVSEGDPIAKVDRISVMTAITGVQDTLDELSGEILDAEDDQAATTVKAKAGGTVKVIYAEVGESAQDVMLQHGALAAISLDDIMAVKVRRASGLDAGDPVCVVFPDGTETDGRVEQNLEGVLTVTMDDDGYAVGEKVTVLTADGDRLGSGELYIFNQWNATAYSGTVSSILVREGASLRTGQDIIRLDDPGHTSEFQRLIDKRQEYEELMQELFRMYKTETITAPCDGIVTGVDKDGIFLLADKGENIVVSFLTNLVSGRKDLFEAHGVRVEKVTGDGMQLQLIGKSAWVKDLGDLSAISVDSGKKTQQWNYTGDTTVYVQSEDGLLRADGTARHGDILLAVGDAENVCWFVRTEGSDGNEENQGSEELALLKNVSVNAGNEVVLHLSEDTGTAKETFSATLKATWGDTVLTGTWKIEYSSFSMVLYGENGDMLYGTPLQAGEHTVTVGFIPADTEEYYTATFPLTIAAPYEIITAELPEGKVGEAYKFTMQVSGSSSGKWGYENLPAGLAIHEETGEISGEPVMTGTFDVKITYTDTQKGTLSKTYEMKISGAQTPGQEGEMPEGDMSGGMDGMSGGGMGGGMPSGGMSGGMMSGGMIQEEDPYYSMEKLTIASVTSQEHMNVEITVDELDISKIYIGQSATVTMEALAGETFAATVTKIANSGENEGGNSKFTVELTLEKSGDMLPGMTASARIVLDTISDVLCIPAAALTKENGKTVVYTSYDADNGVLGTPVEITVGAADADMVQILSALEEGSTFYYAYYDTIEKEVKPSMGARPFG